MKILISCRLQIFKDEKIKTLKIFTKHSCDLQSEPHCLLPEEREKMIKKYSSLSDFELQKLGKVLDKYPYFPLLCKMSRGKEVEELTELFSSPIDSIKNDIKDMIECKPFEYCALVLCVLFHDGFQEAYMKPKTTLQHIEQKVNRIVSNWDINLEIEMKRKMLLDTLKRLDGTYVKKIGSTWTIAHDKLYEIIALSCGRHLVELFIEYAPSSLIAEQFRFSSIFPNPDQDESFLYLSEECENLYFVRLFKDIKEEDGKSFFFNQQLKETRYKDKVMRYINQNKDYCTHLFLDLDVKGVKISDQNDYYSTPLIEASKIGFDDLVTYLKSIDLLPSAIYRMDESSRELYKRALKSGIEIKREIRVLVVGKKGAGKTSLIRRLLSRSLDDVTSTNGIEIHSVLCKDVDMLENEWNVKTQTTDSRLLTSTIQAEKRSSDSVMTTADSRNRTDTSVLYSRMNQEVHPTGSNKEDDPRGKNQLDLNSSNTGTFESLDEIANAQKPEKEPYIAEEFINTEESETPVSAAKKVDIVDQEMIDITKAEINDENDIRISIWDFGGDEEFYHTHQVFLAEDVVFLVVTSLVDSGEGSQGEFRFWFDTIHSLCKNTENLKLKPPCIVIGTHRDKCQSEDDANEKIQTKLKTVGKLRGHFHREIHLISNKEYNAEDINPIKMAVINAAKENEKWQTMHPLKFVLLDKALERKRKENEKKPVVSLKEIKHTNDQITNPLTDEELDLYLRYNHMLGHLIYYTDIPDYIVINPQWLGDVFRCIVTADKFYLNLPQHDWEKVRNTGQVTDTLLQNIFETAEIDSEHQSYFLEVMMKYHILITIEVPGKEKSTSYFAPCMIRNKELKDLSKLFNGDPDDMSTYLCIECNFLPPFLFNRIIIFLCQQYDCDITNEGLPMFFSNGAIFNISLSQCKKLMVVRHKNIIQLQVLMFGESNSGSHSEIKTLIEQELENIIETHSIRIRYEWKWKCPRTPYTNCSVLTKFADCNESQTESCYCKGCRKTHSFGKDWNKSIPSPSTTSSEGISLTKNELNFTRLAMIITEVLTDALYDLLPLSVQKTKARNQCDITCLYSEHRRQNKHVPSVGHWGGVNKVGDILSTSLAVGDDIERIRVMRNNLNHSSHYEIDDKEIDSLYRLIHDVLTRVHNFLNLTWTPTYMDRAEAIKQKTMAPSDMKTIKELLEKESRIIIYHAENINIIHNH